MAHGARGEQADVPSWKADDACCGDGLVDVLLDEIIFIFAGLVHCAIRSRDGADDTLPSTRYGNLVAPAVLESMWAGGHNADSDVGETRGWGPASSGNVPKKAPFAVPASHPGTEHDKCYGISSRGQHAAHQLLHTRLKMASEERPLNVVVIGAGLAGSLAARVLREKHNVTIYERNREASEVGAAINVGPNGVRILDTLHFDRSKVGSLAVKATKVFDKYGKLRINTLRNYAEDYGADWVFQHRADLRDEFLRLATAESESSGIPGRPARIRWGSGVVDIDPDAGKVVLASGEEVFADLIVGRF